MRSETARKVIEAGCDAMTDIGLINATNIDSRFAALAMLRALQEAGPSDQMIREGFIATNGCCDEQAAKDGFLAQIAILIAEMEQSDV